MLPQLGMDNAQVEQTRKLHAELEAHYLSALQQYDLATLPVPNASTNW
jgi:methyl-accepting chemotaxis protein-1 (serine sensor receptor)